MRVITSLILGALICQHCEGIEAAEPRPNIVVILADDLGYGDTSVYDGWVDTPCLEKMAAEGLKFTDFHSNSSVCSPTRAAFLTGRYQQRVGIVDVIVGNRDKHGLSPQELTIPRLLKDSGYTTALFGKWHLGQQAEFNPVHHGFDEYIGYLIGAADYHKHRDWYDGLQRKEQHGYTTHLITDNAVRFIEENQESPFFLFVSHEAVHLPFQTPEDTPENREPIPEGQRWNPERIRPKYKVMLEELDKGIGAILDAVRESERASDTFVFFFSDNGAIGSGGDNTPFRGNKFSHYEGGHRVPAIAWWPGKIEAGLETSELTIGTDLLPTIMELSNTHVPPDRQLDGTSLVRVLMQNESLPKRKLFFGYEPKLGTAMRDGEWKMIISEKRGIELYDLASDVGEKENLATKFPERTERMRQEIEHWKMTTGKHVEPVQGE